MRNNKPTPMTSNPIDPGISNLERQLRSLRQQQKKYSKLVRKMHELQRKSQLITSNQRSSESLAQVQLEQIQRLKESIDTCLTDTQRLQNQYLQLDKQIDLSNKEISSLTKMLQRLRNENSEKRQSIRQKGQQYMNKKKQIQQTMERRDTYEKSIDQLKEQINILTEQEYQLRKDAQILQYEREQEQNVKKNLISYVGKIQQEKGAHEKNICELGRALQSENLRHQNLKEELILLKNQQQDYIDHLHEKQDKLKQLSESVMKKQKKNEEIERELKIVDQNIRVLSDEYLRQRQIFQEQESRNRELNQKFDVVSRDAVDVWDSMKQLLQLAEAHCEDEGYEGLIGIRRQAKQVWNRLQQLIS